MRRCTQTSGIQRFAASTAGVRALFVGGDGDLPLPNPVNGAILPTKTPGIWPMSANREDRSNRF